MERRAELRKEKQDGAAERPGNGPTIRFLPASEQLHTRSCSRCAGLLVTEWCYDLDNTGEHNAKVLRCVQCGHRVDSVILRNQIRPPVESARVGRIGHRYPVSMAMSGKAA
jgi:hypothetical protein